MAAIRDLALASKLLLENVARKQFLRKVRQKFEASMSTFSSKTCIRKMVIVLGRVFSVALATSVVDIAISYVQ